MNGNLIIDGNAVYEIDMDCMEQLEKKREKEKESLDSRRKSGVHQKNILQNKQK